MLSHLAASPLGIIVIHGTLHVYHTDIAMLKNNNIKQSRKLRKGIQLVFVAETFLWALNNIRILAFVHL